VKKKKWATKVELLEVRRANVDQVGEKGITKAAPSGGQHIDATGVRKTEVTGWAHTPKRRLVRTTGQARLRNTKSERGKQASVAVIEHPPRRKL